MSGASCGRLLITAENSARTDRPGMDHARCAALHNYLVKYAWVAEGRPVASLHSYSNNKFLSVYGAEAEALRPRLDPSVAPFLDTTIVQQPTDDRLAFFS